VVVLILTGELFFLLIFAFLIGFSSLFYVGNPARNALISESVDSGSRATAFSTMTFISQITNTMTASAGGFIAVKAGYFPIFYVCVVLDILGMILLATFLKETHKEEENNANGAGGVNITLRTLLPERDLLSLYLIMSVMALGYGTAYSLFYGSLVDRYGFSPLQLGLLSTVFNLVGAVSSIPFGKFSDRYGRRPSLMASWMMAMITAMGFLASRGLEMFLLFSVTNALDMSFFLPAWMALVAEKASPGELSTVMGKLDSYPRLIGIPAPWLGGFLYTSYGFAAPLVAQLVCLMVSGGLIFSLKE
jgi:MFS family permease